MLDENKTGLISLLHSSAGVVSDKGWVDSLRKGNTGVGYTYETLMGIAENNSSDADFFGSIEIKTHRMPARSKLSLFTLSPKIPANAPSVFMGSFGLIDKSGHRSLYTTVSGKRFNNFKKTFQFKLDVDRHKRYLVLEGRSNLSPEPINRAYYTFDELEGGFKKLAMLFLVPANVDKSGDIERFKYGKGGLMKMKDFDTILELIEDGVITLDLRVGVYKSGHNIGKPHDHGSAFRISHTKLHLLFDFAP